MGFKKDDSQKKQKYPWTHKQPADVSRETKTKWRNKQTDNIQKHKTRLKTSTQKLQTKHAGSKTNEEQEEKKNGQGFQER